MGRVVERLSRHHALRARHACRRHRRGHDGHRRRSDGPPRAAAEGAPALHEPGCRGGPARASAGARDEPELRGDAGVARPFTRASMAMPNAGCRWPRRRCAAPRAIRRVAPSSRPLASRQFAVRNYEAAAQAAEAALAEAAGSATPLILGTIRLGPARGASTGPRRPSRGSPRSRQPSSRRDLRGDGSPRNPDYLARAHTFFRIGRRSRPG